MRVRKNGFTLVEILVVVGIIALLTTILVIGIRGQSVRAKMNGTTAFIKSIELALATYHSDFNVYPPSKINGFNYGSDILRQALSEGINGTGKGDVRWKGPYMTFDQDRIGRVQGGVASYTNISHVYANGTSPAPVDGVLLDLFDQPLVYVRADDYQLIGVQRDTLATAVAGETPYAFAGSYQLISLGLDGKSKPGELGGMSSNDNWDNDGDGFTDFEDNQDTVENGTLAEDDITR